MKRWFILLLLFLPALSSWAQEKNFTPGGFIRGSMYLSTGDYTHDVNAASGDAAFTLTASDNKSLRGFADMRLRTGQQFGEDVSNFYLREAWCSYYNNILGISLGKKMINWGKTDFFTPLSRFNPTDYSFRSPDREDADLGNLLAEIVFTPAPAFKLTFVSAPLWNPSILMTAPLTLPASISLDLPSGFLSANGYSSYGVRTDFIFRGVDAGLQWFHGPDLMPGLKLLSADFSNPMIPLLSIKGVPYIINSAGIDFEAVLSAVVIRGTAAWSDPVVGKEGNEEVPFPEVVWVGGMDWTPGIFRITAEYSGKKVLDFYDAPYGSLIGTEPDPAALAELFATPGFNPLEFVRLQTESFNRLYNNQLREYYHSAGLRIEAETLYGKLIPSLSGMYNFTSKDLVVIPSIKYKPADGLSLCAGLEYYSGSEGGLYDIINDFMNAAFFSIRIDF
ncbi:MAG TPA: hypothetical protein VMV74_08590 [Bacteroidales bacterium]|nr:hypothetical protein [Bacteroidales bacterium]